MDLLKTAKLFASCAQGAKMLPRMDAPLPLAGRYRFLRRLRGTSSGVIWLASDSVAGRTVVVSSVTSARVAGLKPAIGLRHPHLATLLELFDDISPGQIPGRVALRPGMAIVVAEHVTGQTLHERLDTGPVQQQRAVMIIEKLAEALHTLHGCGGVHGALSPRSVVITRNDGGVVPVLTNLRAAANGAYCSPERVRGGGPSAEDDAWALHASLFAALTADSPYHGNTREALASAILSGSVPDLSSYGVHDPELERMVLRGLDSDRSSRLCSVAELGQSLAAWLRAHPTDAAEHMSSVPSHPGTIAPPPIDDEDVAEGHRTVALASPISDARMPEDEDEDEDEELETVQLDASEMLMHAAMAKHGSPLGDADDPSLGDQVPTEVMSGDLLDEMVDRVKDQAERARMPMPSETRSMEIAVDDFMPDLSAQDEGDGAEGAQAPPFSPAAESPPKTQPQPAAWPEPPRQAAPSFGGLVPGGEQARAQMAASNAMPPGSGPQKGWGPAEPTPPHLDPHSILSSAPQEPDPEDFVDPAVAQSEEAPEEPAPPRKKRSVIGIVFAGVLLMLLAAVVSFVVAVVLAGGNLPAPIASVLGRATAPIASSPAPVIAVSSPPAVSSTETSAPLPTGSGAVAAASAPPEPDAGDASSHDALAHDATSQHAVDQDASSQDAAVSAPLSEEDLQACVEDFFPDHTFIRKVPFTYLCKEEDPRESSAMLHRQLVRGGAGTVTTGMKIWSSLSWYELAVVTVIRDGCCPGALPLTLPDPGEPCAPMTDALQEVVRGGCTGEAASERAETFANAVLCLYRHERPRPYRYQGVIRPHQRIAFEHFLAQLPAERCSPP